MAIVSCTEVWNREASHDWEFHKVAKREFHVITNDPLDDIIIVLNHGALPALGSNYSSPAGTTDNKLKVSKRTATNYNEDPYNWRVVIDYDSKFPFNPTNANENPLLRPALWKFTFAKGERAVREDLSGAALINSAEDPIDPPVMVSTVVPTFTVEVNRLTFSYSAMLSIVGYCNDATWYTFPARTVLCTGVEAQEVWEANVLYWKLIYSFEVASKKQDGVDPLHRPTRILDMGFNYLDGSTKKIIRDTTTGLALPNPTLLDGAGGKLALGGEPFYLEFDLVPETGFGVIA